MNIVYAVSILIVAAAVLVIRYFKSDRDPDDDIKKNNSDRMLAQYKSKK